jgi:hypothetical protein
MLIIVGVILLVSLLTALIVLYHYHIFKAIQSNMKVAIYSSTAVIFFYLISGLYFLCTAQLSVLFYILCLVYTFGPLFVMILYIRKLQRAARETEKNI